MTRTVEQIPIEIWENIIDCLRDDYHTLQSCMLVCKAWLPRSRHLIPFTVYFYNRHDIVKVAKVKAFRWKGPSWVNIMGGDPLEERRPKPIPHLGAFAVMLARRWPRVKELHITDAVWRPGDMHPDIFRDLATWSSITELVLDHVAFPTVATFARLVSAFPNLQELRCWHLSFAESHFDANKFPRHTPRTTKLITVHVNSKGQSTIDILNFLVASEVIRSVATVTLIDSGPRGMEDIQPSGLQHLLQEAGPAIRELSLGLILSLWRLPPGNSSLLALNKNLVTLRLVLVVENEDVKYDCLNEILSGITSPLIRKIYLSFDLSPITNHEQVLPTLRKFRKDACSVLDKVFRLGIFGHLSEVRIWLSISQDGPQIDPNEWVELPNLSEREILRVDGFYI